MRYLKDAIAGVTILIGLVWSVLWLVRGEQAFANFEHSQRLPAVGAWAVFVHEAGWAVLGPALLLGLTAIAAAVWAHAAYRRSGV